MKFCSVTGCGTSITDGQAETTEKLFGKAFCLEHENGARAEADIAAGACTIDTAPYTKCGFNIQNGLACKTIGQVEVTIDIGKVAAGKPKKECIQAGGYDYELMSNPSVDAEIKTLFKLMDHKGGAGETKKETPAPGGKTENMTNAKAMETKYDEVKKERMPPKVLENAVARIEGLELNTETVLRYLCPDASVEEALMFLQVCKIKNLNPFSPGEVFLIKYDKTQPASIVVGKYAFTKKADQHPDYRGYQAGIIVLTTDGKIEEREGTFYLPRGRNAKEGDVFETLLGGWARIKRENREDLVVKIALQECIRYKKDGQPNRSWAEQPATMIQKTAVVRGLRDTFPAELGGLYEENELREVD